MPPRLIPRSSVCARCLHYHHRQLRPLSTTPPPSPSLPPPPPPSGAVKLTTRALLSLSGLDASHYLQGLTTANMRSGATHGFYAHFLTAQGRVLHDVFIYPAAHSPAFVAGLGGAYASDDPAFLVEVDADEAPRLLKHLKRYKLRAKVDVRAVDAEEWGVWSAWDDAEPWTPHPPASSSGSDASPPASASASSSSPTSTTIGCTDTRAPGMGRRLVLPDTTPPPSAPAPLSAYTIRRILRGVPEGQHEIPRDAALPLESNADFMGGVDFRKGCYVGQELTIRTHHTGVVRKRVLPVALYTRAQGVPARLAYDVDAAGGLPGGGVEAGANILPADGRRGRSAGRWLAGVGNVGLALCRIEMMSDVVLTAEGSKWSAEDEFRLDLGREGGEGEGEGERGDEVRIKAFVPEWVRSRIKVKKQNRQV